MNRISRKIRRKTEGLNMTMKERLRIMAELLKRNRQRDAEHAAKQKESKKAEEEKKCRSKAR